MSSIYCIYITATERVIQKQPLTLDGYTMTVKMVRPARPPPSTPGPLDKDKVLVGGLPHDHQPQDLAVFLGVAGEGAVVRVRYGDKTDRALIELDTIPGNSHKQPPITVGYM